jgi:hypothetical protein
MTGRYKVLLHLDSANCHNDDFRAGWHRLITLCQSLDRDGLHYDVQFTLSDSPHAVVSASGTAKPQKMRRARIATMPPALSTEQIQKRLTAAKQAIIPMATNGHCWPGRQGWRQLRSRQRAIGRIIARAKAQGRSALNDGDIRRAKAVLGNCARWITLTPEGLLETAKREYKPFRPYQPPQPAARLTRLADFAEYAYWLELALLRAGRAA